MAEHKKNSAEAEYGGIPITSHDLRFFTTTEERRGYRIVALIGAALTLLGIVFAVAGVRAAGMTFNLWWVVSLLGLSHLLAYGAMGWGATARRAQPERAVVAALNEQRVDTFWYERGVSNETPETIYKGPDARP